MLLNLFKSIIHSNLYISFAALFLTLATQVQIGMQVQWHPYLFLIFFATLFEYNLHRLITVFFFPEALKTKKHQWVKENRSFFNFIVICSIVGFSIALYETDNLVLWWLSPFALLTLFYSTPLSKTKKGIFRLREVPFLKLFLIAFVWSSVTILLPVIYAKHSIDTWKVILMISERFLFVLSITIPFDIRDMEVDKEAGLKTIPLRTGKQLAERISVISIVLFMAIATTHYLSIGDYHLVVAFLVSGGITLNFLRSKRIQKLPLYHYGLLDGTMILLALLSILAHLIRF